MKNENKTEIVNPIADDIIANANQYGVVKLSDSTSVTSGVNGGIAATPTAVKAVKDRAEFINGNLSNQLARVESDLSSLQNGGAAGAPRYHASDVPVFGLGSETLFGHVKLSDATDLDTTAADGIAATPAAVKAAYDRADEAYNLADSNAGSNDGDVVADSFTARGANFAAPFEWEDGNPDGEDRIGRFVVLTQPEGKIKFGNFNERSFNVFGITTSNPGFTVSNYGADTTGENKAWVNVALMGPTLVQQDGSLIAGDYCYPIEGGIATWGQSGFWVIKIIDSSTAVVLPRIFN